MLATYLKACLIFALARNENRKLSTIAKNQWFLGSPLSLMEWYELNHWYQWFFNGFSDSQPSVAMVFDGYQPLVQRCDGNDTSLQSKSARGIQKKLSVEGNHSIAGGRKGAAKAALCSTKRQ